jgi:outer membrane scaffolding protein for murein synthesis (MipA/OmpV family)
MIGREANMSMGRFKSIILFILIVVLPGTAVCAEKPLWDLGAGLALLQMPDYRGSDKNRLYLLPYPYFIYRGEVFKVDRERISGRLFDTDRVVLEFSFYGQAPVKSADNDARRGMPDLDPTFEAGPALNITLLNNRRADYKLNLTLPVRAMISTDFSSLRHEGWLFAPRLVFEKNDLIPESGVNLGISLGPIFADRAYHAYYYSVESAYSAAFRSAYSASGGYGGSSLTLGMNKRYKQLVFNVFVSADFLYGATIEDSPLVKTKTSLMSGFTVSWIFRTSSVLVKAER